MDVLVIGGSVFLGRAVVEVARDRGDRVTVFNRGRSAPTPDGAEQIVGDRTDVADLDQLVARSFDVVVDTSGYVPSVVGAAADRLADRCGHYVFVSTVNVYPGWPTDPDFHAAGTHDGDPDAGPDDLPDGLVEAQPYGWRKVGCERAVQRAFGPERSTILRAGLIVGPNDSVTGRLPWWIDRVSRGGRVLVPGDAEDPVAMIDARDLAAFGLSAPGGVLETGGPAGRDTRGDLLAACATVTGGDAEPVYVDERWLTDQGVEPWTELPLWGPRSSMPSVFAHDNTAAVAAGLTYRPLIDTVRDTWQWQQSVPGGWSPTANTPGLDPARERELLASWDAR